MNVADFSVLQADNETYAIAPHLPCGVVTPDTLRRLAEVAEKYHAPLIKVTSANRIGIFGLKRDDLETAWSDLGMSPGHLVGLCVRSVRCCPGLGWCKLGQRDAMKVGLELDRRYHGLELPGKMKMAVSGCPINCAEGWVRDVGLYAQGKSKWVLVVGGNVGSRPRLAEELARGFEDDEAVAAVERVVGAYRGAAKKGERLGRTIERLGLNWLREQTGLAGRSEDSKGSQPSG